MAQALPSFFMDDVAITALGVRVPAASIDTGLNYGGSNAPGIGISTENPGLEDSLPNWTLLDQFGDARASQISQLIGGPGISAAGTSAGQEGTLPDAVARFGANPANVAGQPDNDEPIVIGQGCTLTTLAAGWVEAI
jgi:hypothetical protein